MAEEDLRVGEDRALSAPESGFVSRVTGKVPVKKKSKKKITALSASIFLTVILVLVIVGIFMAAPIMVDAIATRLLEQTDVQYADAVQSKALVFQQALHTGNVPKNTAERLEQNGVTVGYIEGDTFVASNVGKREVASIYDTDVISTNEGAPLSVKIGDKVVSWEDFYYEVNHDAALYAAFTNATYGRAAYYYDASAQLVFNKIGTTRNNYGSSDADLNTVMDNLMGSGNKITTNDRSWYYQRECTEKPTGRKDGDGNDITTVSCGGWVVMNDESGANGADADGFIRNTVAYNMSTDQTQAIYNTADALKDADAISKKQRSMLLYAGFAESFSKMKAGYGKLTSDTDSILAAVATLGSSVYGESGINEVMNRLYEQATVKVVDTATGEVKEITGSMLESPSLYAILAGDTIKAESVKDYSSDRVLKTIESQMGVDNIGGTMKTTVATTSNSAGVVSRYTIGDQDDVSHDITPSGTDLTFERDGMPDDEAGTQIVRNEGDYDGRIGAVTETINSSLYENSFEDTVGYIAGELLVEGAINLGSELAKASGAAAGDEEAMMAYMNLTSDVLALDAEAERLTLSPLDISSKNTFLGSIVYKMAVSSVNSGSFLNKLASIVRVTASSVLSMIPGVSADDDSTNNYLDTFGDCETRGNAGASGSATCAETTTFDTSTYGGEKGMIYENGDFSKWKGENLDCDAQNNCEIRDDSFLKKYINYNYGRMTPVGVVDGGILESYDESKKTTVWEKIKSFVSNLLGLSEKAAKGELGDDEYKLATGAEFVDNGGEDWNNYKYAQRYMSLARAADAMRQYDGDLTAYNFDGFGLNNAVVAYISELYGDDTTIAQH